jgi:hypothetical protein
MHQVGATGIKIDRDRISVTQNFQTLMKSITAVIILEVVLFTLLLNKFRLLPI